MPVASSSEQLFGDSSKQEASPPIESVWMLFSVLSEGVLEHWKKSSLLSKTMHRLEDYWQSFLKSSWANHWLPEVRYLKGWTLAEIAILVVIGLLTSSWYTIRNDRKTREEEDKHAHAHAQAQAKQNQTNNNAEGTSSKRQSATPNWLRFNRNLPTLDVGALGFSAGTSWERRYQTLAMFSCSLAFVLPGTCLCWALVVHFGALLPLHVFVWKDYYAPDENYDDDSGGDSYLPRFYQLRTMGTALLVWIYLLYTFLIDSSQTSGTRRPLMRDWFPSWWNHACDFLPVVLVKTADLPAFTTTIIETENGKETKTVPNRYLMGYHPHGIIAVGAFCAFATDGARVLDLSGQTETSEESSDIGNTNNNSSSNNNSNTKSGERNVAPPLGIPLRPSSLSLLDDDDEIPAQTRSLSSSKRGFSTLFPNLDRRIVTLPVNFGTPFIRDYLLAMGAVTSEKATFRKYLDRNHTNSRAMVVVVGGAAESMLAYEGHIALVLKHRRGFVREAILANASLVPVLGFGETNLYSLYDDLEGMDEQKVVTALYPSSTLSLASAFVSVFQKFARDSFGVAVPLFTGRSVFFKSLGVMPRRRPVVVVVGKPIPPPTIKELVGKDDVFSPKIDRTTDQPLNEHGKLLIKWHSKYVKALEELYHDYKDAPWNSPGKRRQQSMKIVR